MIVGDTLLLLHNARREPLRFTLPMTRPEHRSRKDIVSSTVSEPVQVMPASQFGEPRCPLSKLQ